MFELPRHRVGLMRTYFVLAAFVTALVVAQVAQSHTLGAPIMLTATRDVPGSGTDRSFAEGTWSATVLEVQGKPAQAFVRIAVDVGCDGIVDDIAGIGGHPKVGGSLRSNQVIPAACAGLRMTIWGGGHDPASVTVSVNHP